MANKSLQHSSLTDNVFYRSMLAGNAAYFPEFESDDFLEEVVLTTSASSVTFSSLGTYATAGYKHLQIRMVAKTSNYPGFNLRFNSDTGNSYYMHRLYGAGGTVGTSGYGAVNEIRFVNGIPDETAAANEFGAAVVDILDFSSSSKNTTVRASTGAVYTDYPSVQLFSGLWINTAAVTSMTLADPAGGNFVANCRFSLYGSKG